MEQRFTDYLDELDQRAARGEQRSFFMEGVVVAFALPFIVLVLLGEAGATPEQWPPYLIAAAAAGIIAGLLTPPLARRSLEARRQAAYAHMRMRIFGDGMLRDFLGQGGAGEASLTPSTIDAFIEHFLNVTTDNARSAYSYGRGRIEGRELARCIVMRLIASELRQGAALFDEQAQPPDGDETQQYSPAHWHSEPAEQPLYVALASETVRGWTPPDIETLHALEQEGLRREVGGYFRPFLQAALVLGSAIYAGVTYPEYAHWLIAAGLLLGTATGFYSYDLSRRYYIERVRPLVLAQVYSDVFEDLLLRDFIRARRTRHSGYVGDAGPRNAVLDGEARSSEHELRMFVTYFLRERVEPDKSPYYLAAGRHFTDIGKLRALVLYATANGLRQMLEQDSGVFRTW